MSRSVYILGGAQTDFARNWSREGIEIDGLMRAALEEGLAATGLEATDIDSAHIGNFTGELFCGQGQLRSVQRP